MNSLRPLLALCCLPCLLISCSQSPEAYVPPPNPLFTQLPADQTGIHFRNEVVATDSFNVITFRNFYNGGGVGIGDINNDGWADVYLISNSGQNHLYLNRGNWQFEDITEKARVGGTQAWSTGVTMADVNADGWLDIYVCNSGNVKGDKRENELFINQKDLTFREEAARYGLNDKGLSTHASFFDYDNDDDLDCYVLNNSFKQTRKFDYTRELRSVRDTVGGDKLYRNDRGHFTDVSEQAGIYGSEIGFGLGVSVGDLNGDKYPDIYISNDLFERDYLYLNQRNGTFKEVLTEKMGHVSTNSMGADLADINNDGWADVFCTDMLPEDEHRLKTNVRFDDYEVANLKFRSTYHYQYLKNMLQLNNGDGRIGGPTFSEIGSLAGVDATDWSWGALLFDFDNDGWKDIFVSNGMYKDINDMDYIEFLTDRPSVKEIVVKKGRFDYQDFVDRASSTPLPNYAFVNQHNLTFRNQAHSLGLGKPGFSNGAAYGDLDNDGDLDLVVNNLFEECGVYRNEASTQSGNHFLKIRLKGKAGNPFGVGAEVRLYAGNQQQMLQLMPARGFESSVEPVLLFGLGNMLIVDSLVIVWPDLRTQTLRQIRTDQTLTLTYQPTSPLFAPLKTEPALFTNVTDATLTGDYQHREDAFNDFNRQRLQPHLLSTEGPRLAKADVNGDGLEDFFMGGAKGDPGKIFLQTPNGTFQPLPQKEFEEDKYFEDTGVAFLDADGDHDADLLIGAGGNEYEVGTEALALRLYLNNGKGLFLAAPGRLPPLSVNASCVRACDFDGDGDDDVFIGGRCVPGNYGASPRSYLLVNDHGEYRDATPAALQQPGMVTDAAWADYNGDGQTDLILVGEWMAVMLFRNNRGLLSQPLEVAGSRGWWNALSASDLDGDGDPDFVLGNLGLNTKFRATIDRPVRLYVNDFDQNGVPEPIITYYKSDGIAYPYYQRSDMMAQMPVLKKKFLKYAAYAGKTMEQLFTEEQRRGALVRQAERLETSVLLNEGEGRFSLKALPTAAQLSPVFGILVQDLDGDGRKDLFLAGNYYGLKPELGRYDASYGIILTGDGKGGFTSIAPSQSGLLTRGEARDVLNLTTIHNQSLILVARNNDKLQVFRKK